jgi:hypothetical protein
MLENERPEDKTGYKPETFVWSLSDGWAVSFGAFYAGKYVRGDGNAVLYIDYTPDKYTISIELFVVGDDGEEYQATGYATIDGLLATYNGEEDDGDAGDAIEISSIYVGVVDVSADIGAGFNPPDGRYYITRAKYNSTPTPDVPHDTHSGATT